MPYYKRDPRRDHNFDYHPYELESIKGLIGFRVYRVYSGDYSHPQVDRI